MEWSDIHFSRGLYPSDGDVEESKVKAYATEINCEVDRLIFSGHDKARRHQKRHAKTLGKDFCAISTELQIPITELDETTIKSFAYKSIAENEPKLLREIIFSGKLDINGVIDDHRGWNCLMLACYAGCRDLVHLLLENQADVNIQDTCGNTPLTIAAREEFREIVVELIRQGADTEQRDKLGYTAVLVATKFGNADALEALLEKGADVDATLPNGDTALHIAARSGKTAVACLLWRYGCKRDAKNDLGQTALDVAQEQHQHGPERIILASLGRFNELGESKDSIYHKEITGSYDQLLRIWSKGVIDSRLTAHNR